MSENTKTGEDLIEKVEQNVAEATEETKDSGFDPKAFMSEETEAQETKETEEVKDEIKDAEDTREPIEDDGDFTWDSVETDEEEDTSEKEEEDDWDATSDAKPEEDTKEKEDAQAPYDWETLATEVGVKAKSEEEFKSAVKEMLSKPAPVNDTITQLQDFLKMGDRKLVESDLEASGLEKSEIKDTVDRMQDSGLLKREALVLRKNLQNYIANERDRLRKIEKERVAKEEKANLESRQALQKYIKGKEDFFGGKIKNAEKKELYNYITSGEFSEELYSTHANVADAAFLWKYKDKIFKMLQGQGMEKGKAAVINKITNPNLGRKSQHVEMKPKSGFDPVEFMK